MIYRQLAEEFIRDCAPIVKEPAHQKINDFSQGEMVVLDYLARNDGKAAPGEISAGNGLTSSRVANILASLERKQMVGRCHEARDRRKVMVHITDCGRTCVRQKRAEATEALSRLLQALGEEDAREYVRLMRRISGLARKAGMIPPGCPEGGDAVPAKESINDREE